ncbi:EscF/YscF/HrpA family type III secretion system needle major subunit [Burkholderia semiarida]|uniref:EscF/YscF/HrpA family type III secretion system needle major subunit n=1 Tax=Burkholderia semiarida TaxID=2843303 RepID=A0ABW7LED7_9BURK
MKVDAPKFEDLSRAEPPAGTLNGFLIGIHSSIDAAMAPIMKKEEELREKMAEGSISDPTLLAQYQAVTSELAIARNTQSSVIKMFKDIDSGIVGNFR